MSVSARIVPTAAASSSSKRAAPSSAANEARLPEWLYELHPPVPLPTVDLSLSLESRFLSRPALNRMKRFVRRQREIGLASWIALASYFITILVPVAIGRVFALVCIFLWIPATVASLALLRYQVLQLLMTSYDFWFCSCINTSTYFVLAMVMGGGTRALAPLAAWAGVQVNIMIDANIRAVKVWAILNIVGVVNCSLTWAAISLNLIDGTHEFPLVYYKAHELPASAFVASGLLTIMALVARNVYRKREVFFRRSNRSVIECVSYRVNLHFEVFHLQPGRAPSAALPPSDPTRPEYEKKMKYARRLGTLNARCTVLRLLAREYRRRIRSRDVPAGGVADVIEAGWISASVCSAVTFSWLGVVAIAASIGSVFVDVYAPVSSRVPVCQLIALLLTCAYCGICVLHYQLHLLRELWSTFDVLFLLFQLLIVHVGVCDLFQFGRGCVVVLISWLWVLWVLFLDALPPVVKTKLGISRHVVLAVVLVLIGSSFGLVYLLVFADASADIHDRVIWSGHVFSRDVEFRLVPIFYNCFATAFCLVLRLLWRVVVNDSDVLLMLDGAVVYENYLRTARDRNSRRWGSFKSAESPRIEHCHPPESVLSTRSIAVKERE